jgi:hypothetical protein
MSTIYCNNASSGGAVFINGYNNATASIVTSTTQTGMLIGDVINTYSWGINISNCSTPAVQMSIAEVLSMIVSSNSTDAAPAFAAISTTALTMSNPFSTGDLKVSGKAVYNFFTSNP